jgi:hypothetical protein
MSSSSSSSSSSYSSSSSSSSYALCTACPQCPSTMTAVISGASAGFAFMNTTYSMEYGVEHLGDLDCYWASEPEGEGFGFPWAEIICDPNVPEFVFLGHHGSTSLASIIVSIPMVDGCPVPGSYPWTGIGPLTGESGTVVIS